MCGSGTITEDSCGSRTGLWRGHSFYRGKARPGLLRRGLNVLTRIQSTSGIVIHAQRGRKFSESLHLVAAHHGAPESVLHAEFFFLMLPRSLYSSMNLWRSISGGLMLCPWPFRDHCYLSTNCLAVPASQLPPLLCYADHAMSYLLGTMIRGEFEASDRTDCLLRCALCAPD